MIHLFAREVAELADRIEAQFFRIERESRLFSGLINGLIAGVAVAIVAWLMSAFNERDVLLFACLGSSASAVVFAPLSKNNSLRSIIISYVSSAGVCLILSPVHSGALLPLEVQCLLAVMLTTFVMRLTGTLHPAAVGAALAFIIYDRDIRSLILLLLAIVGLLTFVKMLAYIYREELTFRDFHREFRREFYGEELTLTVTDAKPAQVAEQKEHQSSADSRAHLTNLHFLTYVFSLPGQSDQALGQLLNFSWQSPDGGKRA